MSERENLKILVCYHKKDTLLKDDVFTPIHVGRALAKQRLAEDDPDLLWLTENMIGDDTGDNISLKNASYNELTAIYWAWKNYDKLGNPDHIGFMHYRRHFIFRKSERVVENVDGMSENYFDYINYNKETMAHLFDDCDFVAHIGRVDEVRKHYKENHHIEDLERALAILKEKYPSYAKTATDFLKMSYVSFCNMFIMPRSMFFEYCDWLFSLTDAFESAVDLSEKRLFISERLTAIFLEQKKREGFRRKDLPATFVQAPVTVPIAMPYGKHVFLTAAAMLSVLKHAATNTHIKFYLLHTQKVGKEIFRLTEQFPNCTVTFVDVKKEATRLGIDIAKLSLPEHYPLIVSELVNERKLLYLTERAFFFGDVGTFFTTCNNDEYWVLGLPLSPLEKHLRGNVFCLRADRLRSHVFFSRVREYIKGHTAAEIFNRFAVGQTNGFPWWLFNVTDIKKDGEILYESKRGDVRWNVWGRELLYYDEGVEPWVNLQALYSIYWWEVASEIPAGIPFGGIDEGFAALMAKQSADICMDRKTTPDVPPVHHSAYVVRIENKEQHVTLSRVMDYMKLHGVRQTIKRVLQGKDER